MDPAPRTFSYPEALASFPRIRHLTDLAVRRIESLINRVQSIEEMRRRQPELEAAIDAIVRGWTEEVGALGCEVEGRWQVAWDAGDGWWSWRYPEESLGYYRAYHEDERVPVN